MTFSMSMARKLNVSRTHDAHDTIVHCTADRFKCVGFSVRWKMFDLKKISSSTETMRDYGCNIEIGGIKYQTAATPLS